MVEAQESDEAIDVDLFEDEEQILSAPLQNILI